MFPLFSLYFPQTLANPICVDVCVCVCVCVLLHVIVCSITGCPKKALPKIQKDKWLHIGFSGCEEPNKVNSSLGHISTVFFDNPSRPGLPHLW